MRKYLKHPLAFSKLCFSGIPNPIKIVHIIFAGLFLIPLTAPASVLIEVKEIGEDVVFSGTGSINSLNGLYARNQPQSMIEAGIYPSAAVINTGNFTGDLFDTETTPSKFGAGLLGTPETVKGSFAISGSAGLAYPGQISIPQNYSLGSPIEFQMLFPKKNLSSLGIEVGTYEWSWGSAQDGDKVTLKVISPSMRPAAVKPVPAVSTFALISLCGIISAAGVVTMRRRSKRQP